MALASRSSLSRGTEGNIFVFVVRAFLRGISQIYSVGHGLSFNYKSIRAFGVWSPFKKVNILSSTLLRRGAFLMLVGEDVSSTNPKMVKHELVRFY